MVTHLEWSDTIGKRVRTGDWADQAISTVVKIEEELRAAGDEFGLAANRRENAAQLVDYFMEEAKVVYVIYKVWTAGFGNWLLEQGVTPADLDAEIARLNLMMAYPDGTPLEREPRWEALGLRAGRLANGVRSYDLSVEAAIIELDGVREDWRRLHDRSADLMAGILAYVVRLFGQDALETCLRAIMEPYLQERYMPFDVRKTPYEETLDRNLYISLEAMRGHLVGPGRRGDIELIEEDDRWLIRFDPCASGGRILQGDPVEGTGSRVLAPYNFGVLEEARPWTWNETGVCGYCAHCNLALSTIPAERWGHPVRTVDPPLWRGEDDPATRRKCQWTVWKSLEAIPEHEYERIGRTKPQLPVIQPGSRFGRRRPMSFEGRRAIVTGAGSGIGQEVALQLLAAGARVTGVDINDRGLDAVRDAGGQGMAVDLADLEQRESVIASSREDPPHFLVNAAAVLDVIPLADVDAATFRRHFTVNVEAPWFLCRDVGGAIVEGGAIVNFSSPSARWAYTLETAVYGATKTAIQGVTRSFAIALSPRKVRVNAISPGITDTPMQEKVLRQVSALRGLSYEELSVARTKLVPLGRSAPPSEMAGVVVWLLSDAASYITGQTIYVDGGYVMSS